MFSVFSKNFSSSVIADLHQRQPAGRSGGSRKLAVAGFEQRVHGSGIPSAFADLDQSPDKDPDHILEEALTNEFNINLMLILADMNSEE